MAQSPLAGGYGIRGVEANTPAEQAVASQHLLLTDVVTKTNGMKLVGKLAGERKAWKLLTDLEKTHQWSLKCGPVMLVS